MKTENTPENKAKFMALYWGLHICRMQRIDNEYTVKYVLHEWDFMKQNQQEWFLDLKPLSQISDEDAYRVGTMVNCWSKAERSMTFFKDDELKDVHISAGQMFVSAIGKEWGPGMSHPFANNSTDILNAFDYLRSEGYNIGWLDLTAEDILAYGWARLEGKG